MVNFFVVTYHWIPTLDVPCYCTSHHNAASHTSSPHLGLKNISHKGYTRQFRKGLIMDKADHEKEQNSVKIYFLCSTDES